MRQRRDGAGLALEARERVGGVREPLGQDLEGDLASQPRVEGAVDLSHPAGAEWSDDRVRAEPGVGSQPHASSRRL